VVLERVAMHAGKRLRQSRVVQCREFASLAISSCTPAPGLAHGWALKHSHFARIVSLEGYIEAGLNLFLNALLTPSGCRHWQRSAKAWAAAAVQATAARRPARARRPSSSMS